MGRGSTYRRMLCLALWLATAWQPVAAFSDPALAQQRLLFVEAEQALRQGQLGRYQQLKQVLADYPLLPYLEYAELQRNLANAAPQDVLEFLVRHGDTPIAPLLQHRWLQSLARQGRWQLLADNYYLTSDQDLQCRYAHALYQLDQLQRAHVITENLWLTGSSLPGSCDNPLAAWRKAGEMTTELVWKRINLAFQAGEVQLAHFLAGYLPEEDRFWVNLWSKIRRDPAYLREVNAHFEDPDHPILRWITVYGLTRLAQQEPLKAAEYWQELKPVYVFTAQERERVERRLALSLARRTDEESARWLRRLELNHERGEIQSLHIFSALRDQDWQSSLEWLDLLGEDEQHDERWRYWRARTLEGLGRFDEARDIYVLNADRRSYYSFLAADRAGNRYHFAHRPVVFEPDELALVMAIPAMPRAVELYALGRPGDARREWNHALQLMDHSQMLKAARLADQLGWHDRAIVSLAQAQYWDDLELRFPLAHQQQVLAQAQRQNINPAWAFAVIRQESAFTPDARSHAGAMGLMQLMPRTARQVAQSLRIRVSGQHDILDINTNIKLGVSYLRRVSDRFDGNPVLATAAYNAGSTNVRRWLPAEGDMLPADLWVETVPFRETREYLKRVLTYTVIYEQRMGLQPVPLLERMHPIGTRIDPALSRADGDSLDS